MTGTSIRPELVSLVHHVELNKAGWWDGALRQLILAAIWLSGNPLTPESVTETLRSGFSVSPEPTRIGAQIDRLCASGTLLRMPSGELKISEQSLREIESRIKESESVEAEAKIAFTELIGGACPTLDKDRCWKDFNEQMLFPLVQEIGARTYELISGSPMRLERISTFEAFVQHYPDTIQPALRGAIIQFINPKSLAVRSYILRHLNAFFFLEASNLTTQTLTVLNESIVGNASFNLFVDTNVLFSMLGLHENPSNEAAESLVDLLKKLTGKVTGKFYIFPLTVDEFKRVVRSHQEFLSDLRLEPNLAAAGLRSGLTGVTLKFVQESNRAGRPIKATDYFGPYLQDLLRVIRTKGVELYNAKVDEYTMRQDVIDDIVLQQQHELSRPVTKRKDYERLLHDVCLWHFVNDKRRPRVESPIEAQYWIVTVDYRFIGFDAYKRRAAQESIPICVHPTTLIQMLQLWLPRTPDFEEAIVRSLRFAFLFHEFDSTAEKVTIRILESLARFENVRDLDQGTVASVLMSQALRTRLAGAANDDQDAALVKEALIEEHQKVLEKLQTSRLAEERLVDQNRKQDVRIAELESLVSRREREHEELRQSASNDRRDWQGRLDKIERDRQINKFLVFWVCCPVAGILGAGLCVVSFIHTLGHLGFWWSAVTLWSFPLIVWLYLVDRHGSKNAFITDSRTFRLLSTLKNWLFTLFLGPVAGRLLYEVLSKLFKHVTP
jgi:hypothetical protein